MDDKNFTYLDDIIDLTEPGNDNENKGGHRDNYTPPNNIRNYDSSNIKTQMSTNEMFRNNPESLRSQIQYLPQRPNGSQKQSSYYTPINSTENYNHYDSAYDKAYDKFHNPRYDLEMSSPIQPIQPIQIQSNLDMSSNSDDISDHKIKELTNKYDELCYICRKLNDENNVKFHYTYNIIIVFLILIILIMLKKILQV
tara:strand:- start:2477 stop:3067 length:591 start_codon:yes stop_codon:yes gene_type:complete